MRRFLQHRVLFRRILERVQRQQQQRASEAAQWLRALERLEALIDLGVAGQEDEHGARGVDGRVVVGERSEQLLVDDLHEQVPANEKEGGEGELLWIGRREARVSDEVHDGGTRGGAVAGGKRVARAGNPHGARAREQAGDRFERKLGVSLDEGDEGEAIRGSQRQSEATKGNQGVLLDEGDERGVEACRRRAVDGHAGCAVWAKRHLHGLEVVAGDRVAARAHADHWHRRRRR